MAEVGNDETVGNRLCLKCGTFYFGKHSDCPHKESKIKGKNVELANTLFKFLSVENA